MPYLPLNREQNEIRVLSLERTVVESKLVTCTLEQVSLDDLTPEYNEYMSKLKRNYQKPISALGRISFNKWVEHSKQNLSSTQPSKHAFMIPSWRWTYHNDFHSGCQVTGGRDGNTGRFYEFYDSVLEKTGDASSSDIPILPRYRWGDFEALSYCWESEDLEREIILDGKRTKVPKNLEAALQALLLLPEAKSGMKFWADFLCIRQNDTAEKNHQVRLMRKIYASAMSVVAWIGSEADESNKVIDMMERIDMSTGSIYLQVEQGTSVADNQLQEFSLVRSWSGSTLPLNDLSKAPLQSLEALLSRNYWKRLWIIQELALNRNMTLFLCGIKSFSRSMIIRICKFCKNRAEEIDSAIRSQEIQDDASHLDVPHVSGRIWPLVYTLEKLLRMTEYDVIDTVLSAGRKAMVKDKRDKIYGLLGLLPQTIQAEVRPDYDLPVEITYTNFAKSLLVSTNRLDTFLSWCVFREEALTASWVPDWTEPFDRRHINWLKKRQASKDTLSSWGFGDCSKYLTCTSIIVDSITATGITPESSSFYHRKSPSTMSHSIDKTHPNRYGDKSTVSKALLRTLTNDHPFSNKGQRSILDIYWIDWNLVNNSSEEDEHLSALSMQNTTSLNHWWWSFDCFRQANASFSVLGYPFWTFFASLQSNEPPKLEFGGRRTEQDSLTLDYVGASDMKLARLSLSERKLITTKTGYLGLAPCAANVGDEVVILYGCNFPVILRRDNEGFHKVIGECYVDGVMDGEIIDAKDRGEYQEVEITLS
jgi:hypothetical protein